MTTLYTMAQNDNVAQAVAHEHVVRRLNGNVGAGAHGHADVGGRQRGAVVNAVAHHGDHAPLSLRRGHGGAVVHKYAKQAASRPAALPRNDFAFRQMCWQQPACPQCCKH
eukprot:364588-Chlamydomonas_euryale.AAC.10